MIFGFLFSQESSADNWLDDHINSALFLSGGVTSYRSQVADRDFERDDVGHIGYRLNLQMPKVLVLPYVRVQGAKLFGEDALAKTFLPISQWGSFQNFPGDKSISIFQEVWKIY
jgi:hypothetical protein